MHLPINIAFLNSNKLQPKVRVTISQAQEEDMEQIDWMFNSSIRFT